MHEDDEDILAFTSQSLFRVCVQSPWYVSDNVSVAVDTGVLFLCICLK